MHVYYKYPQLLFMSLDHSFSCVIAWLRFFVLVHTTTQKTLYYPLIPSILILSEAGGFTLQKKFVKCDEINNYLLTILPNGLFQKKNPKKGGGGEVEDIIFLKHQWNFLFFCFTPGNSRQNKAQPLDIPQNCVRSLGNSVENKDPWKFHIIFPWSLLEIPLGF